MHEVVFFFFLVTQCGCFPDIYNKEQHAIMQFPDEEWMSDSRMDYYLNSQHSWFNLSSTWTRMAVITCNLIFARVEAGRLETKMQVHH